MNELDVLVAARDLISDRHRWCQRSLAVDEFGSEVEPNDANAVGWCAIGAIRKAIKNDSPRGSRMLVNKISDAIPSFGLHGQSEDYDQSVRVSFANDVYGHDYTMSLFDLVIAQLRSDKVVV